MSADKHSREAELKAERASLAKLEEQYAAERGRLNAELSEAQRAEAEAMRDLAEARKRARDATAARDVIQERADERSGPLRHLNHSWPADNTLKTPHAALHIQSERLSIDDTGTTRHQQTHVFGSCALPRVHVDQILLLLSACIVEKA